MKLRNLDPSRNNYNMPIFIVVIILLRFSSHPSGHSKSPILIQATRQGASNQMGCPTFTKCQPCLDSGCDFFVQTNETTGCTSDIDDIGGNVVFVYGPGDECHNVPVPVPSSISAWPTVIVTVVIVVAPAITIGMYLAKSRRRGQYSTPEKSSVRALIRRGRDRNLELQPIDLEVQDSIL